LDSSTGQLNNSTIRMCGNKIIDSKNQNKVMDKIQHKIGITRQIKE